MGSKGKYYRKFKAFTRLIPLSGQTTLLLSSLALFSISALSQYDARTSRFSQQYPGLVNAYYESGDHIVIKEIAGNKVDPLYSKNSHIPLTRTAVSGEQGLHPDALSGADKAETTESVRRTRRSIQVVPQEQALKQLSRGGDVKPNRSESKAIPVMKSNKQTLTKYLHFSEKTALNFMHFHKTGGVSYKTALFAFFKGKKKGNGEKMRLWESCFETIVKGESHWRCEWDRLWAMNVSERSKMDLVFGHQYWQRGVKDYLNQRDMRTFFSHSTSI